MKVLERNVVRLAVVQHLRSVYGIKIKNWNKYKNKQTSANTVKVFGIALECLPHCHVLDYGDVPCFIVDVCTSLMDHLDTEGLFRKSGSVVRVKSLRGKLEQGQDCLSTAVPLDIAGLLKQFFRELPEPILTTDLHAAFLKIQELPTEDERTSATILLSCVLPDRNLNTLRYFFSFLKSVSQRCAQNKMDSSNLSVIFAPNLFHCGDGAEKMNSSTEKRLRHQAAAVQCLIDNAETLGVVPQFLLEKVPAMLGCDGGLFSPPSVSLEENNTHSDMKKSIRRSLGDVVNGALNKFKTSRTPTNTPQSDRAVFSSATPVIMTPNSKRKLPLESHTHGFSNKKRRSIKKSLGLELFPSALFGGTSTPGSAHSAAGVLESSQSGLLSSVSRNTRSSSRKSNRLRGRSVSRGESGKTGCFSPRVCKKEPVRKSLRLRFSLAKSSRESNIITHSQPGPTGSEVIGWRLATQESCSAFHFTKETVFSPAVLNESPSKVSQLMSNKLLSPQPNSTQHRSLWSGDTPPDVVFTSPTHSFSNTSMSVCLKSSCRSEPTLTVISNHPMTLCCTSREPSSLDSFSEEHCPTTHTPLRIKHTSCQSSSDCVLQTEEAANPDTNSEASSSQLLSEASHKLLESSAVSEFSKCMMDDYNVTFGQVEFVPLSPLHIDSALFETGLTASVETTRDGSLCFKNESKGYLKDASVRSEDCSQLIDALDIQSPVAFRLDTSIRVQSTPYLTRTQSKDSTTPSKQLKVSSSSTSGPQNQAEKQQSSAGTVQTGRMKVADQIKLFNMMTLNSPRAKVVRSPLKFQRTPVHQSIRRFNSLLADRKDDRMGWCAVGPSTPAQKTQSFESGLCTRAQRQTPNTDDLHQPSVFLKPKPLLPPKKADTLHTVLDDITNRALTVKSDTLSANEHAAAVFAKSVCLQVAKNEMNRYRGSPKPPLREGSLLTATKPIDL